MACAYDPDDYDIINDYGDYLDYDDHTETDNYERYDDETADSLCSKEPGELSPSLRSEVHKIRPHQPEIGALRRHRPENGASGSHQPSNGDSRSHPPQLGVHASHRSEYGDPDSRAAESLPHSHHSVADRTDSHEPSIGRPDAHESADNSRGRLSAGSDHGTLDIIGESPRSLADGDAFVPVHDPSASDPLGLNSAKGSEHSDSHSTVPQTPAAALLATSSDLPPLPPKRIRLAKNSEQRYPATGELKEWCENFFMPKILTHKEVDNLLKEVKLPDMPALYAPMFDEILTVVQNTNNKNRNLPKIRFNKAQDGIYQDLQQSLLTAIAPQILARAHANAAGSSSGASTFLDLAERGTETTYHVFCKIWLYRRINVCRAFGVLNASSRTLCATEFDLSAQPGQPPKLFGLSLFNQIFKTAKNISDTIKELAQIREAQGPPPPPPPPAQWGRGRGAYRGSGRGGYRQNNNYNPGGHSDNTRQSGGRTAANKQGFNNGHKSSGQNKGSSHSGPLRVEAEHANSKLRLVAAGSVCEGDQRLQCRLGSGLKLRISAIQPDSRLPQEIEARSGQDHVDSTPLAQPSLVPCSSRASVAESHIFASRDQRSEQSQRGRSSTSRQRGAEVACMAPFGKSLRLRGLSKSASSLFLQSWRKQTSKQYLSAISKWICWCSQQKIDPYSASVEQVANYLAESFDTGLSYSSLNIYRSAIASLLPTLSDGSTIGTHPVIRRVLKGVFNRRPPLPRYSSIWDVDVVLTYIESMGDNTTLSLKQLSHKLVLLLALASPNRVSEIALINFSEGQISDNQARFDISSAKHLRPGKPRLSIVYESLPGNGLLCPLTCLKEYVKRHNISQGPLFRSYSKNSVSVSKDTLARWIKTLLQDAGVDTSKFTAHSTRSASTSKAAASSVPISQILSAGNWSSESTFRRFYHKDAHRSFGSCVLQRKRGSH